MTKPLSKAERRILDAIAASKVARGRLPTTKELCHDAHTGRAHVIRCFARLVELGYLRRTVQTVLVDFVCDSVVTLPPITTLPPGHTLTVENKGGKAIAVIKKPNGDKP